MQAVTTKNIIHALIAVVAGVSIGLFLQPIGGLTTEGVTVLAIFIPTLYLWIVMGPVSWVSILFLAVFILSGIRTPASVWAGSFGHPTFVLVLVFMLFDSNLRETGVIKYMSDWFVTRKFTQGKPYLFLAMFFASNLIIGIFMQNMALAIMYVALTSKLCANLGIKKGDSLYTIMMLGIVWSNAVNHVASPIAKSIPNIIIGLADTNLGIEITYLQWLMVGVPFIFIVLGIIMLCTRIYNPDVAALKNFDIKEFSKNKKPLSKRGKISLIALAALLVMIIVPETLYTMGLSGAVTEFVMGVTITPWVIIMLVVLCLIPVKEKGETKPVMDFAAAVKDLPMGILLFIAAIIFAGAPIGAQSAGIVAAISGLLEPVAVHLPALGIIALLCLIAVILTNFMASTVVATFIFITGTALFAATGYGGTPTALGFIIIGTIAACMGVMMPASTASTALYYGEHIGVRDNLKINIIFLLLTLFAIVALSPIAVAVFS